jgi:hypothetical protein
MLIFRIESVWLGGMYIKWFSGYLQYNGPSIE